jgi:hypothetical protein
MSHGSHSAFALGMKIDRGTWCIADEELQREDKEDELCIGR